MTEKINGQRKDDGGVLLRADGVQRLQVAQLQGGRTLRNHLGRLLQGAGRLLLALGGDHLIKTYNFFHYSFDS